MLWHLIKKEYRSNLLSLKFIISFALLAVLIIVSVSLHTRLYKEEVSDYQSRIMAHKMSLNFIPNYEMLGFSGMMLDKKPPPLSILAQGLDQGANKISRVGLMTFPRLNVGSGGNPLFYTVRTLDYLFIIKIVASLLAILFAYNVVSGEKEGRTLNLTLSNSLPRSTFSLAATRLAKTDFGFQRGFILRAQRFQDEFIKFLAQIPDKQARVDPAKLPLFSLRRGELRGEPGSKHALSGCPAALLGGNYLSFLCTFFEI